MESVLKLLDTAMIGEGSSVDSTDRTDYQNIYFLDLCNSVQFLFVFLTRSLSLRLFKNFIVYPAGTCLNTTITIV